MNQYSNPYTNPQIRGVDFGVIADAGQEAATGIAEANQSLIKQRAEAYEELKNSYADFTDKTTLERLQGLDEQQNNAIRQSAEVSIEDFSRMSQSKKQEILRKVGDIKAARNGLEKMMQIANDPNHVITKGLDDKQYQFLRDLGQAENLEFMPEKEGLGFILKDTRTGEEYSYSDINNMLPMYQNVGDTLKGAKLVYDSEAEKLNKARKDYKSASGQDYPNQQEAYLQAGKTIFENMNAKENKVLYENEVMPHDKWEGTEAQKQAIIEHNARQVEQRQVEVASVPQRSSDGGLTYNESEKANKRNIYLNEANRFQANYLKFKDQKEPKYIEEYLPVGYFVDITPEGFDIYKSSTSIKEGEFFEENLTPETKKKIIKEREPLRSVSFDNDPMGYNTFSLIAGDSFPYLQTEYLNDPSARLTPEQARQELSQFDDSVQVQSTYPLNQASDNFFSFRTLSRKVLNYLSPNQSQPQDSVTPYNPDEALNENKSLNQSERASGL